MTQEDFDALQKRARAKHGIPEPDPPQSIVFTHTDELPDGTRISRDVTREVLAFNAELRNKYGAKRTKYNGRTYDSALEARAARRLDLLVTCGELVSWDPQVTVVIYAKNDVPGLGWFVREKSKHPLKMPNESLMRCRLDFRLRHPDGRVTFLEVKGYGVRDWALRERILRMAGVPLEVQGGKRQRRAKAIRSGSGAGSAASRG